MSRLHNEVHFTYQYSLLQVNFFVLSFQCEFYLTGDNSCNLYMYAQDMYRSLLVVLKCLCVFTSSHKCIRVCKSMHCTSVCWYRQPHASELYVGVCASVCGYDMVCAQFLSIKGIFSDSNSIFFMTWIRRNKQEKKLPKFQLIPLQVMHDYEHWYCSIDYSLMH